MTYRPKASSNREKVLSLVTALAAVSLIIVSGVTQRFGGIYQISAIIFGVISIEFYLKYVGSDYVYDAADDSFKIYKVTGKKSICVSSLDYEMSLSQVISAAEYLENKNQLPKSNFNINLCKNFCPVDYSVYFFEFNGKKCMLKFEPNGDFTEHINKKIENAWIVREESQEY